MKTTAMILFIPVARLTCAATARSNPDAPDGASIGVEARVMLPSGDYAGRNSFGVGVGCRLN